MTRNERRRRTKLKHKARVSWMRREWGHVAHSAKETPTMCSCHGACGNRRRLDWGTDKSRMTKAERRHALQLKEALQEMVA
jgi:hypothetical protein